MISFRYHIVSIIAVFLALALGIVVGTTALNGPITTDLRNQVHSLEKAQAALNSKSSSLQSQVTQAQDFATTYSSQIVKGTLQGKKVLVIDLPGADGNPVASQIAAAGAQSAGQLQLTADYIDPKSAAQLNSLIVNQLHPAGLTLPVDDSPGVVPGALLSWVLLGHGQSSDLTEVLSAFTTSNFLKVVDAKKWGNPTSANLVVVVGAGALPINDPGGQSELALVNRLQQAGGHVVVAGDTPSANQNGIVSLVRADDAAKNTVSTVDNTDTVVGQVSAVIALADLEGASAQVGHFGTGSGAKALFPSPPGQQ